MSWLLQYSYLAMSKSGQEAVVILDMAFQHEDPSESPHLCAKVTQL